MPYDRAGYLNNNGIYGNSGKAFRNAGCGRVNGRKLLKKELHYVETYLNDFNQDFCGENNYNGYNNLGSGYNNCGYNDGGCGFAPSPLPINGGCGPLSINDGCGGGCGPLPINGGCGGGDGCGPLPVNGVCGGGCGCGPVVGNCNEFYSPYNKYDEPCCEKFNGQGQFDNQQQFNNPNQCQCNKAQKKIRRKHKKQSPKSCSCNNPCPTNCNCSNCRRILRKIHK